MESFDEAETEENVLHELDVNSEACKICALCVSAMRNDYIRAKRLEDYYDNYFRWISDFTIPATDNLSERGLQGIQSHMKISGQFENIASAKNYETVKTPSIQRKGLWLLGVL